MIATVEIQMTPPTAAATANTLKRLLKTRPKTDAAMPPTARAAAAKTASMMNPARDGGLVRCSGHVHCCAKH